MPDVLTQVAIPHRKLSNEGREEPFAARGTRRVQVVVDPRIGAEQRDSVLRALLEDSQFEVASVGRASECTVRIDEANSPSDAISVTFGTTRTWIGPLDNLEGFATARAELYAVDEPELRESLVLLGAAERWGCDFFVSDSRGLQTPAAGYFHVPVLTQADAIPVLALLLRTRGVGLTLGPSDGGGQLAPFGLWWFYLVATRGCLPEISRWESAVRSEVDPEALHRDDGDLLGLTFYDAVPVDGVIGRFGHALRARDRIMQAVLSGGGNEASDLIVYEVESLALQLAGALDAAAVAVARQLGMTEDPNRYGWSKDEPRAAMRREWSVPATRTTEWKHLMQALSLVRNRIHGAPLQTVFSMEDDISIILPRKDRDNFAKNVSDLGRSKAWGLADDGLIDPWVLTEQAVEIQPCCPP